MSEIRSMDVEASGVKDGDRGIVYPHPLQPVPDYWARQNMSIWWYNHPSGFVHPSPIWPKDPMMLLDGPSSMSLTSWWRSYGTAMKQNAVMRPDIRTFLLQAKQAELVLAYRDMVPEQERFWQLPAAT